MLLHAPDKFKAVQRTWGSHGESSEKMQREQSPMSRFKLECQKDQPWNAISGAHKASHNGSEKEGRVEKGNSDQATKASTY